MGRILLNGLAPDTEYEVLVVTREISHTGNYKDAFGILLRTEPLVAPEAQKKMLAAVYGAYAGFDTAAYTKASADALKAALLQAARVLGQERATEEEVRAAADAVLKAATSLVPDTAGLKQQLSDANAQAQAREEARKAAEAALARAKEAEKAAQKTIKKLKSGKKYYFRIRAYRTVDGNRIYTKYSAKKQIKL